MNENMKQVIISDGAARLVRRLRTKEGMDEAKAAVCDAMVLALQEAEESGDMRLVRTIGSYYALLTELGSEE